MRRLRTSHRPPCPSNKTFGRGSVSAGKYLVAMMSRAREQAGFCLLVLALGLATNACFAQSAEELESTAVNRIATRLNCPCGCKTNMACRMDPYPCRTCWDNKKKILKMQQDGMSDQAILASFSQEMGSDVVAVPPGTIGSLLSYAAAAFGLIVVLLLIRKYSRKEPAAAGGGPPPHDPLLDRYHDQIEKEVDKLD